MWSVEGWSHLELTKFLFLLYTGDSCSLPTSIDASVEDCTKLTVRLSGGIAGSYTVEYRIDREDSDWIQRSVTLSNSQQVFTGVAGNTE